MNEVFVELMRKLPDDGSEMRGLFLDEDALPLKCGDTIETSDDHKEWTIYSVHRCIELPDGKMDHSHCFDESD